MINLAEIVNPCLQLVIFSLLTMDYDGNVAIILISVAVELGKSVLFWIIRLLMDIRSKSTTGTSIITANPLTRTSCKTE